MRILHVMAGSAAGGAETAFVELVAAQKAGGLDVHAACRPHPRNDIMRAAGVPVTELPFGGMFDFGTAKHLKKLIAGLRPDAVVSWMNRAAAKMPKQLPCPWIARLGGYYDLKYYPRVDHFVVNAPDIGRWMEEQGVDKNRITFIPNFAEIAPDAVPAPRPNAFVFLTLARLHPNKAIDTLLRAFASVPEAVLWIAGDGPERASLEKLSADLGIANRVEFLGWRDDRWSLLAACDAFVLASRHEPFGNSFMQAWAAGKPLITTASQGPSFYVRDGENGLITPVDDPDALAAAMNRLRLDADLRDRLAQAGQAAYHQAFDKRAILIQWQDMVDALRQKAR